MYVRLSGENLTKWNSDEQTFDGITLSSSVSGEWNLEGSWTALAEVDGELGTEVRTACPGCGWRIDSDVAWNVSEVRFFRDSLCEHPVYGHPVATRFSCGGIAVIADNATSSKWCGRAEDWFAVTFPVEEAIKCVHVSGDVTTRLSLRKLETDATWIEESSLPVLSEELGVVKTELRICDIGLCAWIVNSTEAWTIEFIEMFGDSACQNSLTGRPIAGSSGCSGISTISVSDGGSWCCPQGAWAGLWFDAGADVACVRASGTGSVGLSLSYDTVNQWTKKNSVTVLSDDDGIVRAELNTGCDRCMWQVEGGANWSVTHLAAFTDFACNVSEPVSSHAIAA
jgi:hypothetical protein